MKNRNRKTSPELQKIVNPGPAENARTHRVDNPSGGVDYSMPKGRGTSSNDNAAGEKQNQ